MFLQMTVTAGILIMLTFLLRYFFHEKLPKMIFPILWTVVLIRLLVPMSLSTDYSIQGMIDSVRNTSPIEVAMPEAVLLADTPIVANDIVIPPSATIDWLIVLPILWLIGMLITLIFFILTYWKLRQKLRFALPIKHNAFINEWKQSNRLSRKFTILVCDQITTPLTTGILHPKIYLPKRINWAGSLQMEYILAHEFYHIKRFDVLWKLIAIVALCVHWFNPLVWVMCILANRDLEITCDAWVVKKFGLTSKKSYAFTLIGMAEKKKQLMPLYSGFARHATEERVKSIMKGSRTSLVSGIAAILLLPILTLAAFATPPRNESEHENELDHVTNVIDRPINDEVSLNSTYHDDDPVFVDAEVAAKSELISEPRWGMDGSAWGVNTDPTLGHSVGIQAFLDTFEAWNDAIVVSREATSDSRFYDSYFSEMWEVDLYGNRYIITSWRSTNPTYPHAYEIRIEAK